MPTPAALLADLRDHGGLACAPITARRWPTSGSRPLIRAVEVFGFHLATVDLRQSSDRHEEVAGRTARRRPASRPDYAGLDEEAKQALLLRLLGDPRPLRLPFATYSERAQGEFDIFVKARTLRRAFGPEAIRHYIISHTETVSDLLEVLAAAEGVRPAARRRRRRRATPRPT